jgi:hypothetical protein
MESAVCPVSDARDGRPLRGAVRYPLRLRVVLLIDGHESVAITEDVSASGLLLQLHQPLRVGQMMDFLLEIPVGALGFSVTGAVQGSARVVRAYWKNGRPYVAAVIEEYRFQ